VIIFTKHALDRMKQRAITKDEIIHVLTNSKERMKDILGHSIAQLDSNGIILRIFFVEREQDIIVITAYKTSKEKYRTK